MLYLLQYSFYRGEQTRHTTELDPPVVPWETKVIYIYSYGQIGGQGRREAD
jgi:hypothetical protein